MDRLRHETRAQHRATEAIAFSTAILDGTLPRAAYAGQLMAYLPIHRALERAVERSRHPAVGSVWRARMRRTPLLEADLAVLGVTGDEDGAARGHAQAMVDWIESLAASDPISLLGVVYVLEGSSLGGAILRGHLAAAYGLTDAGLRYYAPYGSHPKPHWVDFGKRMNLAVADAADADRVVAAAAQTFTRIGHLLEALFEPEPAAAAV
jgi:heme oxygenase